MTRSSSTPGDRRSGAGPPPITATRSSSKTAATCPRAGPATPTCSRSASRRCSVPVLGRSRRPRLLGKRRDRQRAARGLLEHIGGLLARARVELDEQVDDDPAVVLVLVEAHVREELAGAVVAEGGVAQRVTGLRTRARLDIVCVDRDGAGGDPRRAGDHPLPAILDRLDAPLEELQVRLV